MSRGEKRRQQKAAAKTAQQGTYTHTPQEEQALDLAVHYHQAGQLPEAERIYRTVLATNPNHPMALHYLGLLAHQVGNNDLSVELFNKAIAVEPEYVEAHCNLANTLLQMGRAEEAETHCREAIAIEPDRVNAYNHLAKALRVLGHFDESIATSQKALALNPDQLDAYETLGSVLGNLGRYDETIETYQKAIVIHPDAALFHNNLGSALAMQGQPEQAVECYQKAIALQPDFVLAYQNLSNALRGLERNDEAIACLQKALEYAPDVSSLRHNLNALLGNTTDSAPKEYVEELFDPYATRFESDLTQKLQYKMPTVMKETLVKLGLAEGKFEHVVDLGCGTGLAGVAFRDVAKTLTGIDLSKNMVRQAEAKGVYDQLLVDDLVAGLERLDGEIDLFVCADVFIYVGNLQATFAAVRKSAAPNALFVLSTEHTDTTDTFVLQDTSRYAHAKAYIEALADEFGFTLEYFEQTDLRKEKSGWLAGGIYVLKL